MFLAVSTASGSDCSLPGLASATSRHLLAVSEDVIECRSARGERCNPGSDELGLADNRGETTSTSNGYA